MHRATPIRSALKRVLGAAGAFPLQTRRRYARSAWRLRSGGSIWQPSQLAGRTSHRIRSSEGKRFVLL